MTTTENKMSELCSLYFYQLLGGVLKIDQLISKKFFKNLTSVETRGIEIAGGSIQRQ